MKTIVVTSAVPGEGKSTTIANLAVVFAQQKKKVLLIDADLRKPTVHYTFNYSNTFGLTNALTKQAELQEVIKESQEDNLFVLTSGPIPPNPAELLGSKAMEQLLKEVEKEFDMVLFEPPLLAVTDAQVLASKCDGAILVVSSGRTETEQAVEAKELLEAANSHIIGVVLNNKKMDKGKDYYYYGAE